VGLNNAGSLMAGAAYVPWVLATLSGSLRLSFKIPLLATLVALQGLTGDPQSVLFSLLASIAFMAWNERRKRAALALAGGFGLAGLLAAVQLVPAWYLLGQSNRSVVNSRFFEQFALHPIRLLEFIAPFPLGGYLTKPHFWAAFAVNGPGIWPFALSAYLGAAAATAVLIGAGKNRRTGFGISLLLVGVLLALGPHGPLQPILSPPPFRFFRYPRKIPPHPIRGNAGAYSPGDGEDPRGTERPQWAVRRRHCSGRTRAGDRGAPSFPRGSGAGLGRGDSRCPCSTTPRRCSGNSL